MACPRGCPEGQEPVAGSPGPHALRPGELVGRHPLSTEPDQVDARALAGPIGPDGSQPPDTKALYEVLLREHAPMLRVYLRSLTGDDALTDDLFQETAIVAWRRLGDFDRTQPFGPWLRGIGRRLTLHEAARRGRVARPIDPERIEALVGAMERLPGDVFEDRVAGVRTCVESLPDPARELVKGYYWGGSSLAQIADATAQGLERVKKRLQRARAMVLDCLRVRGVMPAVDAEGAGT